MRPSNPLIYLASASPRRSALLHQIGVEHRIAPVDIDEAAEASELPHDYVQRLARSKAERLWSNLSPAQRLPVLGADTTVALAEEVLGKPGSAEECARMLAKLSGRTHRVLTAVALRHTEGCELSLSISEVTFRHLARSEIDAYWRSGEPCDKAGAYAIQGQAALFIERITGSYSGVVGLPLFETGELLRRIGWTPFASGFAQETQMGVCG